jgi:ABC-type microcin C transport system permease subunit YejE
MRFKRNKVGVISAILSITVLSLSLMAPLVKAVADLGVKDSHRALSFIQAITDASTKRIESGHDAEEEIAYATTFCINGLTSK